MTLPSDPYSLLHLHASGRGLTRDSIRTIVEHIQIVSFQAGDVVLHPNQLVDALYLVSAGRLRVAMVLPGGVERTISYVGRDDQVGLLALHQDEPTQIKVVAEQPTISLRIPREQALRLIHECPLWGRNLLRAVGPQVRNTVLGLKQRNRKRVIVLIHATQQTRQFTLQLVEALTNLGETVGVASDRHDTLGLDLPRSMSLLNSLGDQLPADDVRRELAAWSDVERVILDCQLSSSVGYLYDLIVAGEAIYCVCGSDVASELAVALKPILERSPRLREKIFAIRLLDEHEQVAPLVPELNDCCAHDFKMHWILRGNHAPAPTRQPGMTRLLHHLRDASVGLALGGGAARGMAHLGVLQVIEEAGITIDCMSGTSAGALVGIPFAAGYGADFLIDAFATDLKPGWIYRMLPYGDVAYVLLKYRFGGWDPMLRKYLKDWQLRQLPTPFSSVAVDLVAAEPVVRSEGDAAKAILESINLPGIARPICVDGKTLVDGGVLDVVPADVVAGQGANLIISSDVSAHIAFEFYGNRPETPTEAMKRPSGAASLIRTRTVQDRNIRSIGGGAADIVIAPDVSGVQVTDFKHADKIAVLGREAAEAALPELKRVLHELDPQLFPL